MMPRDILQQAIELYGKEKQVDMAIEEMSELTKALLKERRKDAVTGFSPDIPRLLDDVYEEIADVEIMIEQLMLMKQEGLISIKKI